MLTYSGINLYGTLSATMRTQGTNILLNMFFGPILNAASGFAGQVQSAVASFSNNLLAAFRPQIIINYVNGNKEIMAKYIRYAAKYGYLMLFLIGLPLYLEMPAILQFWLKNVPEYTVAFCRLTLLFSGIASLANALVAGLHAVGKIKVPNLFNGSLYLTVIPITYYLFKHNAPPVWPFILNVIFVFVGGCAHLITLKYHVKEFSVVKISLLSGLIIVPPRKEAEKSIFQAAVLYWYIVQRLSFLKAMLS